MQLFYTVHDRDNDRVGFAPAIHDSPEVLVQFNDNNVLATVHTIDDSAYGYWSKNKVDILRWLSRILASHW